MREISEINPEFFQTLLQIDLQKYDKYRSEFQFLKPFNLMLALHTHDLEKHLSWQHGQIIKELGEEHEVSKMYEKMISAIGDMHYALNSAQIKDDRILKKYSHNIMSVLSDNNLILTTKSERLLKDEVGNKAFKIWEMSKNALPVPDAFFLTFAATRISYAAKQVLPGILKQAMYYFKGKAVAIRSSGLLSMPGMLDTVYVKDSYNYEEVSAAIMQVIESWYNEKAVKYRKLCKIDDNMQIGVVIQELIAADNQTGFSGTAYSRNPNTGENIISGEILFAEMGAKLASGEKTPQPLTSIDPKFYQELQQHLNRLEEKHHSVQYIEFACDGEKLYLVQNRDAKLTDLARGKSGIDFYKKGWIDSTRLNRLYEDLKYNGKGVRAHIATEKAIATGIASSAGVVTGKIRLNSSQFSYSTDKQIWFTDITTTDDLEKIKNIDGLVTTSGGYTSHPAEVSRMLKIPAIVSAQPIQLFEDHVLIGEKKFFENDIVTIVGDSGEIFNGKIEVKNVFVLDEEFKTILK